MSGVGEGKDSPVELIAAVDKEEDARPPSGLLHGVEMNTIAQAIWKVHSTRSPEEFQNLKAKIQNDDVRAR